MILRRKMRPNRKKRKMIVGDKMNKKNKRKTNKKKKRKNRVKKRKRLDGMNKMINKMGPFLKEHWRSRKLKLRMTMMMMIGTKMKKLQPERRNKLKNPKNKTLMIAGWLQIKMKTTVKGYQS